MTQLCLTTHTSQLFGHVAYRKILEINVAALNIFCIKIYTLINTSVKTNFNVSKIAWNWNKFLVFHLLYISGTMIRIGKDSPVACLSAPREGRSVIAPYFGVRLG